MARDIKKEVVNFLYGNGYEIDEIAEALEISAADVVDYLDI